MPDNDQPSTVASVGVALTTLDTELNSGDLDDQPAKWQQLYAMRKHLDDQQRALLVKEFQADDVAYQALAKTINAEVTALNKLIKDVTQIDQVINVLANISSNVDQMLKLA